MLHPRQLRRRAAGLAVTAGLIALAGCDLGAPPTTYPLPGGGVVAGDINGDGHLDLLSSTETELSVVLGDGHGGFGAATTSPHTPCVTQPDPENPYLNCSQRRVDVADANDDGAADLFVMDQIYASYPPPGGESRWSTVALRLNDGSGQFGAPVHLADAQSNLNYSPPVASIGDATGDGFPDVVFVGGFEPGPQIAIHAGDGVGHVGPAVVSQKPTGNLASGPEIADLNADGHSDLVFPGGCWDGTIRGCLDVMLGNGTGAFPTFTRYMADDPAVDAVGRTGAMGDIDEDGDLDYVGGNVGTDFMDEPDKVGSFSIFLGDGAGGFGPEISTPSYTQTVGVRLADFDLDGHLDVLLSEDDEDPNTSGWWHIRFGDGDGHFSGDHLIPPGVGFLADLDHDGKVDAYRMVAGGVEVFLNRWDGRP